MKFVYSYEDIKDVKITKEHERFLNSSIKNTGLSDGVKQLTLPNVLSPMFNSFMVNFNEQSITVLTTPITCFLGNENEKLDKQEFFTRLVKFIIYVNAIGKESGLIFEPFYVGDELSLRYLNGDFYNSISHCDCDDCKILLNAIVTRYEHRTSFFKLQTDLFFDSVIKNNRRFYLKSINKENGKSSIWYTDENGVCIQHRSGSIEYILFGQTLTFEQRLVIEELYIDIGDDELFDKEIFIKINKSLTERLSSKYDYLLETQTK